MPSFVRSFAILAAILGTGRGEAVRRKRGFFTSLGREEIGWLGRESWSTRQWGGYSQHARNNNVLYLFKHRVQVVLGGPRGRELLLKPAMNPMEAIGETRQSSPGLCWVTRKKTVLSGAFCWMTTEPTLRKYVVVVARSGRHWLWRRIARVGLKAVADLDQSEGGLTWVSQ